MYRKSSEKTELAVATEVKTQISLSVQHTYPGCLKKKKRTLKIDLQRYLSVTEENTFAAQYIQTQVAKISYKINYKIPCFSSENSEVTYKFPKRSAGRVSHRQPFSNK